MISGLLTTYAVSKPQALVILNEGIFGTLVVIGAVVALAAVLARRKSMLKLAAVGIILMLSGGLVFAVSNPFNETTIAVGQGSVRASAPPYFNLDLTPAQIQRAYVVDLGEWNVTVTARTGGTAFGSYRAGYFKLSNGASADILSSGQMALVLVLTSGTYVILGPDDFQSFVSDFDQSVMQAQSA